MSRLKVHPSYSSIVASLALFVALGGTGYAALKLPRDSVTSRELAQNAVGRSELRRAAVDSARIRRNTIRSDDIRDGSIEPRDLRNGFVVRRADSAGRADRAENADRADLAVTATRADVAASLDLGSSGTRPAHRFVDACPNGFDIGPGELCVELALHLPLPLLGASSACSDQLARLPTPAEVLAYSDRSQFPGAERQMTSGIFTLNGTDFQIVTIGGPGTFGTAPVTEPRPFRCVRGVSNR